MSIIEYSYMRVGDVWTEKDHLELIHAVHEIEKTAEGMCNLARGTVPQGAAA